MTAPLLIDIGAAPACCTDHALEALYKSLGDRPDDGIWAPHHDPFVSDLIEDITRRGLAILGAILGAVEPAPAMAKAAPWVRTDAATLARIGRDLAAKAPADYTVDDWLRLIDWTVATYLPDGVIQGEAEYLAVKSVFAGRIQAAIDHPVPAAVAAALATVAPATVISSAGVAAFTGRQAAVLHFARLRAADLVTEIGEQARRRLRAIVVDHEERKALGQAPTLWDLQSRMQDEFAVLNRDWRRVAVTETGRNANEGFIASMPEGARVQRQEHYPDACPFCKRIHGMVLTVVDPAKEPKDGWAEVWSGKSNVGRSASPRRRDGDALVERLPSELWWPAAGVQHPHCRGRWVRVKDAAPPPGVDPKFAAWLEGKLASIGNS